MCITQVCLLCKSKPSKSFKKVLLEAMRCCLYPQHEHISRVSFLVCLSVFACTPVHSNSPTTSTDSLACIAGALTKQLSDLPLSFVKTCVAHVPDIVIEYMRIPQW